MTPFTAYFNAVLKYLTVTSPDTGVTVRLIIPFADSKAVVAIEELAFVTMLDSETYMSESPLNAVMFEKYDSPVDALVICNAYVAVL